MTNTIMSPQLTKKPVTLKGHFPFLELPAEIRNTIYEMVLCDIQDAEVPGMGDIPQNFDLAMNQHDVHPQLLRTCHQIHDEAKYVMVKKNLFVEVEFLTGRETHLNHGLFEMLVLSRVPFLRIKRDIEVRGDIKMPGNFGGCIMHHRISMVGGSRWGQQRGDSMLLLHRHMDQFFAAISHTKWFMDMFNLNERACHEVAFLDPFQVVLESAPGNKLDFSRNTTSTRSFSLEWLVNLRNKLLSPYPVELRALHSTVEKYAIEMDDSLTLDVVKEPTDAEVVMRDLHQLTEDGNAHHHRKSYGYAEAYFQLVEYKISVLMNKATKQTMELFEEDGEYLEGQLKDMYASICINRSKNAVACMHAYAHENRDELPERCSLVKDMATQIENPIQFPGLTLDPEIAAEFLKLQAVAYRLMGDRESIDKAQEKIRAALVSFPGDKLLVDEEHLILKIKRELDEIQNRQADNTFSSLCNRWFSG